MRKLLIFGNGLGRALNNEYYNLECALQDAWSNPKALDQTQKELIRRCLPEEVLEHETLVAPRSEEELDVLQKVLAACDEIIQHEIEGGASWLSEHGKKFPFAIRSYLHHTASYFHHSPFSLPDTFSRPLLQWVVDSRSHIATLNYDELLYRSFIRSSAFNGFDCLLDGFVPNFDKSNLDRRNPVRQSYYLHLHGSPLYYTDVKGNLKKSALSNLPLIEGHASAHLVLTNVRHKTTVISASPILQEYWKRLEEAMKESDALFLRFPLTSV